VDGPGESAVSPEEVTMEDASRGGHWDGVYRRKAETQVSWFEPTPQVSLSLLESVGAGPGHSVIDVGGGASRLVDELVRRGYRDVAVLDIARSALQAARERLGEGAAAVDWINADVREWTPRRAYDVWHDRAAFHFLLSESDRRAYHDRLLAALRSGGHVIIGTFAADGPERCSGLPVVRHDAEALSAFLGPSFRPVTSLKHAHTTPSGATQRFQFAAFTRTA
jgi:SAM-dependent methyltransferase